MYNKPTFFSRLLVVVLLISILPVMIANAQTANKAFGAVISAVYPDGYLAGGRDEAFQVMNVGSQDIDITGWSVTNNKACLG